ARTRHTGDVALAFAVAQMEARTLRCRFCHPEVVIMRRFLWSCAILFAAGLGGAFAQFIRGGAGPVLAAMVGFPSGVATGTATATGLHWTNASPYLIGVDAAGAVSLYSISPNGNYATVSATRSSDNQLGTSQSIIADACIAANDNTTVNHKVWCRYNHGVITAPSVTRQHINDENSILNLALSVPLDPYTPNPVGSSINLRLDSGIGTGVGNNVSAALQILSNSAKYNSGIVIGSTAIDTNEAIALAVNHTINVYSGAGTVGASIMFGAGSPAGVVSCTARCLYI